MTSTTASFSRVCIPFIPRPPRFWLRKFSTVIRLMYPSCVAVMTVGSSGIISSAEISNRSNPICVLLSSPYLSEISISSFLITRRSSCLSERIMRRRAIVSCRVLYSPSILLLSKPVRARRRISTIACACASERPNLLMSSALAT